MSPGARVVLQSAYVLHRRPYRESSALVELYARDHGRVGVVVRGRRQNAALQPFGPLLVSWSGRGELASLVAAEAVTPAPWLQGRGLIAALYLNEVLMRLLPRQDPHPGIYDSYEATLVRLTQGLDGGAEWALRLFEKRLLEDLGYGLLLSHEADTGRPLAPERRYAYRLEEGPVALRDDMHDDLVIGGASLLALQSECLDEAADPGEIKRLMRAALALQLGERPLHSRRLFS